MPFKAWSLLKADRGGRNIFAKRSRCEQQLYCWHHARKEEVRKAFGKYRFIYGNKVVHIKVPQILGLRLPDIIDFAEKHIDIHSFMPEYKTFRYPSRQWVCNVGMVILFDFGSGNVGTKRIQRVYQISNRAAGCWIY